MHLLTFFGVANYRETTYTFQGQEVTSRFAPAAACRFLQADKVTIFLTEEAAQSELFTDLKHSFPPGIVPNTVPVPLGKNEQELWQVFDQLCRSVDPTDEMALDITHGLRSFPLLGLLAAAFLKLGLNIRLKAVLYGAYDVGVQVSPGKTPVFDLSPMLTLLEWSAAADRFNRTGDSRYLAALVLEQRKILALNTGGSHELLEQVGYLGNLAGTLKDISQSLQLIRPYNSMQSIASLPERVEKTREILMRSPAAQPFSILLKSVVDTYLPLAHTDPKNPDSLWETLRIERAMIAWFIERELWVQAVSVAREWLLSWVMAHLGQTQLLSSNAREVTTSLLGSEAAEYRKSRQAANDYQSVFLGNVPKINIVLQLWPDLTRVRNDIVHAAKREEPGNPDSLKKQICEYAEILFDLPMKGNE